MIERALHHINETAKIPSFSTYEERLNPYIRDFFSDISGSKEIDVAGNSLIFQLNSQPEYPTIALAAHLDKINHYGQDYPDELPVVITEKYIEGAMDDCTGLGIILTLAEAAAEQNWPNLLFFFSEMEESKGLKECPELLKNNGEGYDHGMGAIRIAERCLSLDLLPDKVITLDTTPLFKGEKGIALYSKHWELNGLDPSLKLIEQTEKTVGQLISIDPKIKINNNTNDYLHYGEVFNKKGPNSVVSIALEPAIYPYHQKGERVFLDDIRRCLDITATYLSNSIS